MATPPTRATIANAVRQIQHALLDGASCSERHLFAAATVLSRADYEDVVVELSIADLCGFPVCRKPLPSDRPRRGRFRISLKEHRVYDLEETYKYCSEACVVSSRAFAASFADERSSDLSASKLEEILDLFRSRKSSEVDLGKGGDLGFPNLTIQEKEDPGKGEVSLDEWMGPSNAIEGYIPKYDAHGAHKQGEKPKEAKGDTPYESDFKSDIILSTDRTLDVSEAIAKKLEEVVIGERKAKTKAKSKSSRSKTSKRLEKGNAKEVEFKSGNAADGGLSAAAQKSPELEFTSTLLVKGQDSNAHAVGKKPLPGKLDNAINVENESELKDAAHRSENKGSIENEPALKSSLKTSRSKNVSRSVRWADEKENLSKEERKDVPSRKGPQEAVDEDGRLRLASAEACAAALVGAAEAVSSGISEAADAVSEAGIVILPRPEGAKETHIEEDDAFELDSGCVKWPKKTVLLDTDMFEVEDSWHDTPPAGFNLELSSFATMWMALFGWVTCSSIAYVYGHDESSQEDFLFVNGKDYPRKIVSREGQSLEIRRAIDGCVCRALPGLVRELRFPQPISALEKSLGCLLDTMSFMEALPAFKIRQWQVIVLLFLDALSVHRIPSLTPYVANIDMLLHKVLNAAQVGQEEYETMRDHLIPFGRSSDATV